MPVRAANLLKLLCPVCGKGKIFRGYLDTPDKCPHCGFYFMRETGYFLPHAPISYLAFVAAAVFAWAVLSYGLRVESGAVMLTTMIALGLAFSVWSNRYAKMIWLAIDLTLHPPTREDFEPRGR